MVQEASVTTPSIPCTLCLMDIALVLAVMSYIYAALSENEIITKRDIYYRDVDLFRSQVVVDEIIAQIATHVGVQRYVLPNSELSQR